MAKRAQVYDPEISSSNGSDYEHDRKKLRSHKNKEEKKSSSDTSSGVEIVGAQPSEAQSPRRSRATAPSPQPHAHPMPTVNQTPVSASSQGYNNATHSDQITAATASGSADRDSVTIPLGEIRLVYVDDSTWYWTVPPELLPRDTRLDQAMIVWDALDHGAQSVFDDEVYEFARVVEYSCEQESRG